MKEPWTKVLPLVLMVVLALTRWPGLMPPNFSAVYALAFCAGVYFPGALAYWLPLGTMLVADLGLNLYYETSRGIPSFTVPVLLFMAGNYLGYIVLIALGRRFKSSTAWWKLLAGGLGGALLFYLITNTASWLLNPFKNPEYTRDVAGWIVALTLGTKGYPPTWEFLRSTLLSGGLFTALFAGAMKLCERFEESESDETEPEVEGATEESQA